MFWLVHELRYGAVEVDHQSQPACGDERLDSFNSLKEVRRRSWGHINSIGLGRGLVKRVKNIGYGPIDDGGRHPDLVLVVS